MIKKKSSPNSLRCELGLSFCFVQELQSLSVRVFGVRAPKFQKLLHFRPLPLKDGSATIVILNPGIGMLPAFNFICVETQPCETFYLASLAWMSVWKNKRKLWMKQRPRWEIKRPIPLRKGKREPESAEMADVDGEQRASTMKQHNCLALTTNRFQRFKLTMPCLIFSTRLPLLILQWIHIISEEWLRISKLQDWGKDLLTLLLK